MARGRIIKKETDPKVAELLTRHDKIVDRRLLYEPTMIEIAKYIYPMVNNFEDDTSQGKKRTNYILDSSVMRAVRIASDGYQSYMFPRSSPWFKLGFAQEALMERQDISVWMKKIEQAMYGELARSDFYQEAGQTIDIGLTLGTGSCYTEDSPPERCSQYITMHPKEVYVGRNKLGIVDTLHRRYLMTGRQILDAFSDEIDRALTKPEIKALEEGAFETFPVVHIVAPRTDRDIKKLDKANKPWASYYILEETQKMLREGGYDEFPFAVWACRLNSDEDYGRSPGWDALPDVKRLQHMAKAVLQAVQTQARPPMFYPQEMDDILDLGPGGRNPYRDFSRGITPIQTSLNLQHAAALVNEIRQIVNDHFDVPFFLMFASRDKLQKTATEVAEIAGERAALMGTMVGRIETDFLDVVLELSIRNAARQRRLPPLPPALRSQGQADLRIEYIGPLATLQKRYHGQQNMTTTMAQAAPFIQVWPESRHVVNAPAAVRTILTQGGFDPGSIRPVEETEALVNAEAQAVQQAQQMEQAKQLGQALPGLGTAPEPGSPAEAGVKMAQGGGA